jgi:hypothetical protein
MGKSKGCIMPWDLDQFIDEDERKPNKTVRKPKTCNQPKP